MSENFRIRFFWAIVPILLTIVSCSKDDDAKEYTVNSELNPYLQRFLSEATQRGKNFDLENDGLIMEFADLESPVVGLCTYSDPIKVQIDRTYWSQTASSANCENLREDVVFHELAHGLLRRSHDNSTLPNTEWETLMCGGSTVDDRSWAINFNGARKKYYLDELFAITVDAPEYTKVTSFQGNLGTQKYGTDFSKMSDTEMSKKNDIASQIKDGVMLFSNQNNTNILYSLVSKIPSADFHFDVVMKADLLTSSNMMGLFVSSSDEVTNYFALTDKKRMNVWNTECILPFAEVLVENYYDADDFAKFSLRKEGDELYFYINDMLVYWNDYALDSYTSVGLILPDNGSLSLQSYAYYLLTEEQRSGSIPETKVVPLVQKKLNSEGFER